MTVGTVLMVCGAAAVVSLLVLVAYGAVFLVAAATTVRRRAEADPLVADLDAFLHGVFDWRMTDPPSRSGRAHLS